MSSKQEQLLKNRIADLEDALRKALDELAAPGKRQSEINDLNERLDESERRSAEYLRQIQELNTRIASVPNVVERLNSALAAADDLKEQLENAKVDNERLKRELASKADQIAQFGSVGESLRAQMEARDRLEQQVSAFGEKLAESDRKAQKL